MAMTNVAADPPVPWLTVAFTLNFSGAVGFVRVDCAGDGRNPEAINAINPMTVVDNTSSCEGKRQRARLRARDGINSHAIRVHVEAADRRR